MPTSDGLGTLKRMIKEPLISSMLYTQAGPAALSGVRPSAKGRVVIIGLNVISAGSSHRDPLRQWSSMASGAMGTQTLRSLLGAGEFDMPARFAADQLALKCGMSMEAALDSTVGGAYSRYCSVIGGCGGVNDYRVLAANAAAEAAAQSGDPAKVESAEAAKVVALELQAKGSRKGRKINPRFGDPPKVLTLKEAKAAEKKAVKKAKKKAKFEAEITEARAAAAAGGEV